MKPPPVAFKGIWWRVVQRQMGRCPRRVPNKQTARREAVVTLPVASVYLAARRQVCVTEVGGALQLACVWSRLCVRQALRVPLDYRVTHVQASVWNLLSDNARETETFAA